jgi:hypothetical protein
LRVDRVTADSLISLTEVAIEVAMPFTQTAPPDGSPGTRVVDGDWLEIHADGMHRWHERR